MEVKLLPMRRDSYTRYPRPILWLVQGGTFTVGGDEADAQPRFEAQVDSFYISKLPVSNEQLEAFDKTFKRSPASPGDRDPAAGVSFERAVAYCEQYADVSRKPMRLPTEIEWEYACRAGALGRGFVPESAEPDDFIWHSGNSGEGLPRLEAKKANGFGLYGMLGGLWEWTSSIYGPYALEKDPVALEEEASRVLRGGSFKTGCDEISCSLRRSASVSASSDDHGFRIVKSFR